MLLSRSFPSLDCHPALDAGPKPERRNPRGGWRVTALSTGQLSGVVPGFAGLRSSAGMTVMFDAAKAPS